MLFLCFHGINFSSLLTEGLIKQTSSPLLYFSSYTVFSASNPIFQKAFSSVVCPTMTIRSCGGGTLWVFSNVHVRSWLSKVKYMAMPCVLPFIIIILKTLLFVEYITLLIKFLILFLQYIPWWVSLFLSFLQKPYFSYSLL